MAVVTSSSKDEAFLILNRLGLKKYFKAILTAEDIAKSKPNPESYLKGAIALSVKPHECIVVEDALSGIAAAKAAGMFVIAVLNTHSKDEL